MMRKIVLLIIFTASVVAAELKTVTVKKSGADELKDAMDAKTDAPDINFGQIVQSTTEVSPTTFKKETSSISTESETTGHAIPLENSIDSSEESPPIIVDIEKIPISPRRKVIYINQQQNGKLNVHLDVSDVSIVLIPKQNNPQQSLLELLLRSAQKSSLQNKPKEKEQIKTGNHHDDYSKYKNISVRPSEENHHSPPLMPNIPFIESRAPYKVDISSTLAQQPQPVVDIVPNAHQQNNTQFHLQFSRSPIMQLLQPLQPLPPPKSNRIYKRSIDTHLLGINSDDDLPSSENDELTEHIMNSLDIYDVNDADSNEGSEFILLGAVENCGPGRYRDSYQICQPMQNMDY